jgi:hypothetical protein
MSDDVAAIARLEKRVRQCECLREISGNHTYYSGMIQGLLEAAEIVRTHKP